MSVTERDRQNARDAMVAGWNACKQTNYFGMNARQKCDCDQGAIDGCRARVEELAKVIAANRIHGAVGGSRDA